MTNDKLQISNSKFQSAGEPSSRKLERAGGRGLGRLLVACLAWWSGVGAFGKIRAQYETDPRGCGVLTCVQGERILWGSVWHRQISASRL
jgi:hypothetical protein